MEMVTVKHAGAVIQLPHDVVVKNFLHSIEPVAGKSESTPKIGDYWHGQGGYYAGIMRGENGKPDRHIIVPDIESCHMNGEWECKGKEIDGAGSELHGLGNTIAMADAGSKIAKQILSLEIDGHKDFYLMARHEARLCFLNVPELFKKEAHWTSTQSSADNSCYQNFGSGHQSTDNKYHELHVRPVRSFVSNLSI